MALATTYDLGVIGGGMMGSALVRAFLNAGVLRADRVLVSDVYPATLTALADDLGVATTDDNSLLVGQSTVVMLAVKPQMLGAVLEPLTLRADQLVVSIAAGVTLAKLATLTSDSQPLVRVMPNILATVAQASSAFAPNARVTEAQADLVERLLGAAGVAVKVEERLMDAVTGLPGSGPAFVAVFAEALIDGGVVAGLPRAAATQLTAQMLRGVGEWLLQTGGSPAQLKDMVTSPGGTTIAGLRALEAGGLRSAALEAVVAAAQRSKELGS